MSDAAAPHHASDDGRGLVRAARAGDATARDQLFAACRETLAAFLRGRVGPGLARYVSLSDLGQDVFVRALSGLEHLHDDATLSDFEQLLRRQARWVAADQGRQAAAYHGESAANEPAHVLPDRYGERSRGEVTRADERRWLDEQIARLDAKYAAVLRLRLDGLDFDAIAVRLGISKETARKRYLRAGVMLRENGARRAD